MSLPRIFSLVCLCLGLSLASLSQTNAPKEPEHYQIQPPGSLAPAGQLQSGNPRGVGLPRFSPTDFYVSSYTPDDEYRHLAQVGKSQGWQGVESAFGKLPNRGHVVSSASSTALSRPAPFGCDNAIRVARVEMKGQEKVIRLIVKCSSLDAYGNYPSPVHQYGASPDFKFTVVELRLNSQGEGEGVMVTNAKLSFDEQGRLQVQPFDDTTVIKIASVKQVK